MNRYQRDRRTAPPPAPPVERVSVSGEHSRLRIALIIFFLVLAIVSIGYGVHSLLNKELGWMEIEAKSDAETNCAWELELYYEPYTTAETKALSSRYTELAVEAYRCFHAGERFSGVGNLRSVNDAPNQTVEIAPALYSALETLLAGGSRGLYLAPVYEIYGNVFCSSDDFEAARFDPLTDAESAAYIQSLLPFVNDPDAVSLELLGDDRVCLRVSEAYLACAEENEIRTFVDLCWMKNAFVVDYIADALAADGYTRLNLCSRDGFCRSLDTRGERYGLPVYSRTEKVNRLEGQLEFTPPVSAVRLRDWSPTEELTDYIYTYSDGRSVTAYLDPADGLCRSAVPDLLCYSPSRPCGALLSAAMALYIADEPDLDRAQALAGQDIFVFFFRDGAAYHTGPAEFVS